MTGTTTHDQDLAAKAAEEAKTEAAPGPAAKPRRVSPMRILIALGICAILFGGLISARRHSSSVRFWSNQAADRVLGRIGRQDLNLDQAEARMRALYATHNLPFEPAQTRIVIDKAHRRLELYSGDQLLRNYPVGLSGAPAGHKEKKGDGRTPSGQYHIAYRKMNSPYHLFLGLNYPNGADAASAFEQERISAEERDALIACEQAHKTPPFDTALSGAIGIHGGGASRDWTLGCIAVENDAIEELWSVTQHWTPVEVRE